MHDYHDHCLYEKGAIIARAYPVEDLEDGGEKHDQGDVEREAGGGAGAVDGDDLVRV